MSKYSAWFPMKAKPIRAGVYEILDPFGRHWFSFWNSDGWHGGWSDIAYAATQTFYVHDDIGGNDKWRGLAEKPE